MNSIKSFLKESARFLGYAIAGALTIALAADLTIGFSMKADMFSSEHKPSVKVSSLEIDVAGAVLTDIVQNIGTNKEDLSLHPDHVTLGVVFVQNYDPTNSVVYGEDADNPFGKIKPGEIGFFRVDTTVTNISMKALTNAVNVRAWVVEN